VTNAAVHSHGQHGIDEERTVAIQSALIREHFLTGEPSGVWDQTSKDAMLRFQAANAGRRRLPRIRAPSSSSDSGLITKAC